MNKIIELNQKEISIISGGDGITFKNIGDHAGFWLGGAAGLGMVLTGTYSVLICIMKLDRIHGEVNKKLPNVLPFGAIIGCAKVGSKVCSYLGHKIDQVLGLS